jgi:hypothetical protein
MNGLLWPRLHFGDGGTLDLNPIQEYEREAVEAEWRAVHVRVEWLHSPKGRLDKALFAEVESVVGTDSPSS